MIFIEMYIFIDKIDFEIYSVDTDEKNQLMKEKIMIPKAFDIGAKLSYIRKTLNTLINQYKVKNAYINIDNNVGIEIIETTKIEGVIEELFSNSGVEIWK